MTATLQIQYRYYTTSVHVVQIHSTTENINNTEFIDITEHIDNNENIDNTENVDNTENIDNNSDVRDMYITPP